MQVHTHLTAIESGRVQIQSELQNTPVWLDCDGVVLATNRVSNDGVYKELQPALASGKLDSLRLIGDSEAPSIIAEAVFSGHLAAQEFDEIVSDEVPNFRREWVKI